MIKRQWIISAIVSLLILFIGGALSAKLKSQKKSTVTETDGAKTEDLLKSAGITNWEELSKASPATLRGVLTGPSLSLIHI